MVGYIEAKAEFACSVRALVILSSTGNMFSFMLSMREWVMRAVVLVMGFYIASCSLDARRGLQASLEYCGE